ncbi:hypothetical protein MGSAQ_000668 [marine sediment metagenome]|uniref:Uncharacterized protein n=1 Tax=marine sediment metagenome TaxID=412755 RepID=A0A1B6NWL5_9ZZZZ
MCRTFHCIVKTWFTLSSLCRWVTTAKINGVRVLFLALNVL